MSLDVTLRDPGPKYGDLVLYDANITHNLNTMADHAGLYNALWRPYRLMPEYVEGDHEAERKFEDSVKVLALDLIPTIENGLKDLKSRPEYFRQFDSPNGWGTYENLVRFTEEYLDALKSYPDAIVEVSR